MGGVFFGCVPDGKEVLKLLHGQDTYKSAALTIRKKWRGEQKCFGSAFTVAISDTVTDATGEGDEGLCCFIFQSLQFLRIVRILGILQRV